jgi:hypothetical protein
MPVNTLLVACVVVLAVLSSKRVYSSVIEVLPANKNLCQVGADA